MMIDDEKVKSEFIKVALNNVAVSERCLSVCFFKKNVYICVDFG